MLNIIVVELKRRVLADGTLNQISFRQKTKNFTPLFEGLLIINTLMITHSIDKWLERCEKKLAEHFEVLAEAYLGAYEYEARCFCRPTCACTLQHIATLAFETTTGLPTLMAIHPPRGRNSSALRLFSLRKLFLHSESNELAHVSATVRWHSRFSCWLFFVYDILVYIPSS